MSFAGAAAVIPWDATPEQVASALAGLPTIDSVVVTRAGPDDQNGFTWTVVFSSPLGIQGGTPIFCPAL